MSYSFSITAATKAEAKDKVFTELVKVCETQPVHANDSQQANAAAIAFIDILADDESKDVFVNMNGSVSWMHGQDEKKMTNAAVSVSVSLIDRALAV